MPNNQIQSLTISGTTYDIVDNTSGYATEGYVDVIAPFEIHIVDSGMGSYEYNDVTWAQIVAAYEAGKKLVLIVDYGEYYITTYEVLYNGWNEETSENELSDFVFTYTQSNYSEESTYEAYYTIYHFDLNSEGVWCQSIVGDEKLYTQDLNNSDITVYPILDTQPNSSTTKRVDTDGFAYNTYMSINTGNLGYSKLILGNSTAQGTAGNKQGSIQLYGSTAYKHILSGAPTADRTLTLPDNTGTIALTSDIPTVPTKTSDLTNDSGFITGMTILSYGTSTWNDFLTAYNANKVVYCRASSNSNPASGSQTRLAFMAYVNNATTPTNVEFQYYRSVNTHTESQQGDQVYVYKLDKTAGWSVTAREASVKVVAGTGLSGTYSNGTMTLTGPTNISAFTNDSGYITSYTETDPTVPSWAKAESKPTYTASEVGALPSSTTYVSKITTTAGAHTAISNKSGAVSFNVPTNTSHLTNDSGFVTTDTNTTYSLSNALSSHKFTETLTAGGSGSGTSTATIELAAGTGISLTDDTSNKKITINCTVTNSDEKVKSAAVTAATTYYLIGSTNATTETATTSKHGSVSISVGADSNTSGGSRLTLGNSTAEGTAGAKYGYLRLYGNTTHYVDLQTEASYPTANRTIYLPSYGGTMYLTCTSTTDAVGGATSAPVYVDNTGRIQEIESLELGLVKKPFMRATGSGTRVNLSASTITQVPLTTIEFQGEYSGISLDTTKHTILLEPGYYRISGSIYFASGVTYSSMQGIYIRMDSTSIAFANATEVAASYIYGSISINTSAIVKVVDDSYLWLGARSSTTATVDSNNTATYLTAEKIGSIY